MVRLRADRVLTPEGMLVDGWVEFDGGRITAQGSGPITGAEDLGPVTLAPGFVDMHAHGGGGAAYTDGPEAARTVLATHLAHGTTAQMASLVTDTIDNLEDQVYALRPLVEADDLLGIHLEGPWLAHEHKGAHDPALLRDPYLDDVDRLCGAGGGTVAMATIAVEREHGIDAVRRLVSHGVIAAPGHSHATYAQANEAIAAGASVATHLFNAMRPLHHREPGIIGAALGSPGVVVEIIADGVHVHPAAIRLAIDAARGGFVLVTDAMAATDVGDGAYILGPLHVTVTDGVARLTDGGAIAGSTLTLDRAVQFCVQQVGVPLVDAVRAATQTPADVLGRADLGRLAPGARADAVALDERLEVVGVWARGRRIR